MLTDREREHFWWVQFTELIDPWKWKTQPNSQAVLGDKKKRLISMFDLESWAQAWQQPARHVNSLLGDRITFSINFFCCVSSFSFFFLLIICTYFCRLHFALPPHSASMCIFVQNCQRHKCSAGDRAAESMMLMIMRAATLLALIGCTIDQIAANAW